MADVPVLSMTFSRPVPGADPVVWERYVNWSNEVYTPLTIKQPGVKGSDFFRIVRESPQYPLTGYLAYNENFDVIEKRRDNPESKAIRDELALWRQRGILEFFWRVNYERMKCVRPANTSAYEQDLNMPVGCILNMEALFLSAKEEEDYEKWLREYGFNIFLPLFVRLPGLAGYDCYKCLDVNGRGEAVETKYPLYLSLVYFDNIESCENYTKSAEFVAYQKALRNILPLGTNYKWFVQYRLDRSWRK